MKLFRYQDKKYLGPWSGENSSAIFLKTIDKIGNRMSSIDEHDSFHDGLYSAFNNQHVLNSVITSAEHKILEKHGYKLYSFDVDNQFVKITDRIQSGFLLFTSPTEITMKNIQAESYPDKV